MEEKKAEIGFSYLGERRQTIYFRRGKRILEEDNVFQLGSEKNIES
jgi:hypothetical protein